MEIQQQTYALINLIIDTCECQMTKITLERGSNCLFITLPFCFPRESSVNKHKCAFFVWRTTTLSFVIKVRAHELTLTCFVCTILSVEKNVVCTTRKLFLAIEFWRGNKRSSWDSFESFAIFYAFIRRWKNIFTAKKISMCTETSFKLTLSHFMVNEYQLNA